MAPSVTNAITANGVTLDIAGDETFLQSLARELSDPLSLHYVNQYNAVVSTLRERAPVLSPIDITNARAVQFARSNPPQLASAILQSLQHRIGSEIADGIEAGETVSGIKDRVNAIVGDPKAAERIARTETTYAFTQAREAAWIDSKVVKAKEWLLSSDPCPICEGVARIRRIVPIGQPFFKMGDTFPTTDGRIFVVNFRNIDAPPIHPNDRCSFGAVFIEG